MSKTKKKKKLSDSKLHAVKKEPKKLNAFEMHVNRRKFNVVGMKLKSEKGLPGISRSRAIKKRKATLLQEYKWKDKKNMFLDKRIGEKNNAMTAEDKIMARFTAERAKLHSKTSIFNLGDGEELTHRGESLIDIEKYDDPRSDDEFEDEKEQGKLDASFVEEAHFGGGMLKKVNSESKSRKDVIEQLIADSKKRKAEKQKVREEMMDLTVKLDSEWKELLPLVTSAHMNQGGEDTSAKKDKKTANYDILSKQLKFEARGKPVDRLKSEEEIAKEERERLEALERDRLKRMLGESTQAPPKHRSADDLDDGFELDDLSKTVLSYDKDGLPNVSKDEIFDKRNHKSNENGVKGAGYEENHEEDEDEDEDVDEDENENEGEDEGEDADGDGDKDEEEEIEDEAEGSDVENDQKSFENDTDNLSDLKESDESDEEGKQSIQNRTKKSKLVDKISKKKKETNLTDEKALNSQINQDNVDKKNTEVVEQLPYTFEIPNEYESFEKLMFNSDCSGQAVIIERMVKCHHPSLNSMNKEKLETLFTYMLQYLEDLTHEESPKDNCFKILDRISPFLYDLAQFSPDSCASAMLTVIKEKYQNFLKRSKVYPGLDTLVFIKLVSLLFSTSDYRNKVATPTLIFMQDILANCAVSSSVDLSIGLFISTLVLEFCSFSKRFVPEVIHFIKGVLSLCHARELKIPLFLPFRSQHFEKFNLLLSDKLKSYTIEKMSFKELTIEDNSDEFKLKAISLTLEILSELCDLWSDKNAAVLIFESFPNLLDIKNFSPCLKNQVENVFQKITQLKGKPLARLVFEKKRPKPLKLYEPRIEEIYSLKKHKPMSREKQEKAKLLHKYKRELKGALREIRKDSSFLSKLKLKQIQKSDIERHRKVREILGSVAQQTGEVRKLKRKK